jgi:hypothetical protein
MSSVYEQVGAIGSWTLSLRPDTPTSVLDAIDVETWGFSQLIVTATDVDPLDYSAEDLCSVSIYGGMYDTQDDERLTLSGTGLLGYFGGANSIGPIALAGLTDTKSFDDWVTDLTLPGFIGSSATGPSPLDYTLDRDMTYREFLEILVDEHNYTDSFYIDHRLMEFRRTILTPPVDNDATAVLATPWWDGREVGSAIPMMRSTFRVRRSVEKWVGKAYVTTDAGTTSDETSPMPFQDPGGTDIRREIAVTETSIAGSGASMATSLLSDGVPREITLYTDEYDVASLLKPVAGCHLKCYDPVQGIYDFSATPRIARGELIWPVNLRIESMRWPIREGMGVTLRRSDGALIRLSEWMVPGTGAAQIDTGAPGHRPLVGSVSTKGTRRQV